MNDIEIDIKDSIRVDTDDGWFQYIEYPSCLFVVHLQGRERGKGNRLLDTVVGLAREKGKELWGTVSPHGDMSAERLLAWYRKRLNAVVVGKYYGHDLIRTRLRTE